MSSAAPHVWRDRLCPELPTRVRVTRALKHPPWLWVSVAWIRDDRPLFCSSVSAYDAAAPTCLLQVVGPMIGRSTIATFKVFHAGSTCKRPALPRITQKAQSRDLSCACAMVSSISVGCSVDWTRTC